MLQETGGQLCWWLRVWAKWLLYNKACPAAFALGISAQALADIWDYLVRYRQVEDAIGLPRTLVKLARNLAYEDVINFAMGKLFQQVS